MITFVISRAAFGLSFRMHHFAFLLFTFSVRIRFRASDRRGRE